MLLKDKFKLYRKENNLTQKQFAEILEMKRTAITEIERGKVKGTMKLIQKLSDVTNKPSSYWLDGESEQNYKTYESLDIIIDVLIDSDMISKDGKVNELGIKMIMSVLEKEIALKIKKHGN